MDEAGLGDILESRVIRDFRRLFYEITGMVTALSFPQWRKGEVDCLPRDGKCRFCRLVQSSRRGMELCRVSDARNDARMRASGKPCVSSCYLGLTGVAAPVFLRGEFVGAVLSGDVLTHPASAARLARVRKALAGMDIDLPELEQAYFEIPVVPRRTLHLATEMLSLIVNYIVDREQVIGLQEAIYQKQREIADVMGERAGLESDLRAKMTEVQALRRQLLSAMGGGKQQLRPPSGTHRKRMVDEAAAYIDSCYTEPLTLADVAAHVRLSPNYLSTLFREERGCTFSDYVVRKRIARACELLHDMHLNVTEVGMRVGYDDPSHFSHLFRRVMGVSPRAFRDGRGTLPVGGQA